MRALLWTLAVIGCGIGLGIWFARINISRAGRASSANSPFTNRPEILPQDIYVWQRAWTPAVYEAVDAGVSNFRRVVVLAAEISLRSGEAKATEIRPDYAKLSKSLHEIGLAIRIGPLPADASAAMEPDSLQTKLICEAASKAVAQARSAGLEVMEVQIDFDCAESKLPEYLNWIRAVRPVVSPAPVVITALPSWLKHREFADLAREVGMFVLQVHSLHKPDGPESSMNLCDTDEAKSAVAQAAKIGVPFRVALPTYSYLAGFSPDGKLLGLSAEGPEPAWPAGTILRIMRSDPDSLAGLVDEWLSSRPPEMTGLIWYRLPISGDAMNWHMTTLKAVMAGRRPKPDVHPVVVHTKPGLLDVFLRNDGEADGTLQCNVTVEWNGADLVAAEGINGFEQLDALAGNVTFRASSVPVGRWIAPGEQIQIGWLRLSVDKEVRTNVSPISP